MKCLKGLILTLEISLFLAAADTNAGQQSDVDAVRAVNQTFYEAISAEDMGRFETIWIHEPYVSAIHPVSSAVDRGWESVRQSFVNIFESWDNIQSSMPEPSIRVTEAIAWVTGEEDFRAVKGDNGDDVVVKLLATNVFEKRGDQWLMVHHHVSLAANPD